MRGLSLFLALLLGCVPFSLKAGVLLSLKDSPEMNGKLTLTATSIHVEGSSTRDVDLSDVLEADFSDAPFELQYFNSEGVTSGLPSNWTAKPIDDPDVSKGSASFANGVLTVTGDGANLELHPDHYFFAGMPWTGDGQWTAHYKELSPPVSATDPSITQVVMSLRSGLDTGLGLFDVAVSGNGDQTLKVGGGGYKGQPGKFPLWLRVTRCGKSLETASLNDDNHTWEPISEDSRELPNKSWIGFMVDSRVPKAMGSAMIDHITFTPDPAQPEFVRPGILLKSGSFLAGEAFHFSDTEGAIVHNDKQVIFKTEQLAAAVYHPVTMRQIAAAAGQHGVIMLNGDFLTSDIQNVSAAGGGGMAQMNSITLGAVTYYSDRVCACVANQVEPMASDYEIRLRDGSIIQAKSFSMTNGQVTIGEVSGVTIDLDPAEIAQFRAGSARVQNLIDLPWKITSPSTAPGSRAAAATSHDPATKPSAALDTNSAAATPPGDAGAGVNANSASDLIPPSVETWQGPHQEQMLVSAAGSAIDFPLAGKFRAVSLRMVISPGSPSNAQASLRILCDGREVGRTPAIKSGDAPRLVSVTIQSPKILTFKVDSSTPGTRLLIIDPVAIRDH